MPAPSGGGDGPPEGLEGDARNGDEGGPGARQERGRLQQQQVVLMIGIAGSGKTTLSRSEYADHAHVSLDAIKEDPGRRRELIKMYTHRMGEGGSLSNSRRAEYVLIDDALAAGRSVVVDDTNLTEAIRRGHIEHAREYGAAVRAVYFTDAARAFRQNSQRAGRKRVPDWVLAIQEGDLAPPSMEEGYASIRNVW